MVGGEETRRAGVGESGKFWESLIESLSLSAHQMHGGEGQVVVASSLGERGMSEPAVIDIITQSVQR